MTKPHEARVYRYAYVSLVLAAALGAYAALTTTGAVLGVTVPPIVMLALLAVGLAVGIVAVRRRSLLVAGIGAGVLVLGVVPAGALAPGVLGYATGFLFGALLLVYTELVHQTSRHDRASRVIHEEGVADDTLERVTDETLRTLATRVAMATGLAAAGAGLVLLLASVGPDVFREGIETSAPLGVAVASLVLFAIIGLIVLVRGASFRFELRVRSKTKEVADLEVE